MALTAVILDFASVADSPDSGESLLRTTLGTATVLPLIAGRLRGLEVDAILVAPAFEPDDAYVRCVSAVLSGAAAHTDIVRLAELHEQLLHAEAADHFLIVDARRLSGPPFAFDRLLKDISRCRVVRHLVYSSQVARVRERVVYNGEREVRRVERLYDGVTDYDFSTVGASLFSAAQVRELHRYDLANLNALRLEFVRRGIPSEDVGIKDGMVNLTTEAGLLTVNDWVLANLESQTPTAGYVRLTPSIWTADDATIAKSVRVYGPVVVQPGARIGAEAVVIGPTSIGAFAHVGAGATVARCVVASGAEIKPQAFVRDRVIHSTINEDVAAPAAVPEPLLVAARAAYAGPRGTYHSAPARAASPIPSLYEVVKRALDATFAAAGLLVLSPVLLVVAALIRLTSRGPAVFGHDREGRNGEVFRCWKFRTMVSDAHAQQRALYQANALDGPQFKLANDPRITPVGGWLRRTNLDELPQLFNVLRGEMSLIGPRPSPFRENQICVPWRAARLSVRPGITGLWQVCRCDRAYGDFHQWIYFDMLYVRHRSLGLDGRILLATLLTLGGRWGVPVKWMIPALRRGRSTRTTPYDKDHANGNGRVASTNNRSRRAVPVPAAAGGGSGGVG